MFNLLAVRSAAIPRLTRQLNDPTLPAESHMQLSDQLEYENNKANKGRTENTLRQHNLLPAVFAMLKAMGETGTLGGFRGRDVAHSPRQGSRRGASQRAGPEGAQRKGAAVMKVTAAVASGSVCEAHHIAAHVRRRECNPTMTRSGIIHCSAPRSPGRIVFSAPYSFHALLRAV